jgi:REP element-mobilizing transposase RayT
MSFAYSVRDQEAVHFVTFTVHQWADVFTRQLYVDELLASLKYCQTHKGLEIYAWVIMSNHAHMIIRAKDGNLSDIIRDLKKFTSKRVFQLISENPHESRREWLMKVLSHEGRIWFWEEGYHGEEVYSLDFFESKVNYIHQNPVRAGIVDKEEEYLNSSARQLYGLPDDRLMLSRFG